MANNKIPLTIAGLHLLISTPEDEAYVTEIAREIDSNINSVLEQSASASVTNAILLCTIDYFDSFKKSTKAANNMRAQIKDYMAEAASAKREYDEEHKRAEELASEMQALRNHLTRIATEGDSSGVFTKLRDDLSNASTELQKQRKRFADLSSQNKALSEKSDAMSSYIAGQDREIARLTALTEDLTGRLTEKAESAGLASAKLAGYEKMLQEQQTEITRLTNELNILAQLIDEDRASNNAAPESRPIMEQGISEQRVSEPAVNDIVQQILEQETDDNAKLSASEQAPSFSSAEPAFQSTSKIESVTELEPAVTPVVSSDEHSSASSVFTTVRRKPEPDPGTMTKSLSETVSDMLSNKHAGFDSSDALLSDNRNEIVIESPYTAPVPSKRHSERDYDDAINLVEDRRNRPSNSRSIKDFDIDINDMHQEEKLRPEDEPSGEDFNDFVIEEEENILGFKTLRHIPNEDNNQSVEYRNDDKTENEEETQPSQPIQKFREDDSEPDLSWTRNL